MISAAPRLMIGSCSSTGRNSTKLKASGLYHTDSGGARQRAVPDPSGAYNIWVMAVATDRPSGPPKPPLWRRRWFRRVLISIGGLTLLFLLVVGVAALPALGHRARDPPAHPGHQDLRRQRRGDHRAACGAAHPGAPGPDPSVAARRDPGDGRSSLLFALGDRSDRSGAGDRPELPARADRRGREHHHPAAH